NDLCTGRTYTVLLMRERADLLQFLIHQYHCVDWTCKGPRVQDQEWEGMWASDWQENWQQLDDFWHQKFRTLLSDVEKEVFLQLLDSERATAARADAARQGSASAVRNETAVTPTAVVADEMDSMAGGCLSCAVVVAHAAKDKENSAKQPVVEPSPSWEQHSTATVAELPLEEPEVQQQQMYPVEEVVVSPLGGEPTVDIKWHKAGQLSETLVLGED
ncbi:unnamed protein product, partial [Pylaiella littoralis]